MNTQNSLNNFVCILFFIVLLFGCKSKVEKEMYKGYALIEAYDIEGNNSNLNLYLLNGYDLHQSLKSYLDTISSLDCLILTINKDSFNYKYVEKIKKFKKSKKFNFVLIKYSLLTKEKKMIIDSFDSNITLENRKVLINVRHYLENDVTLKIDMLDNID